jgi:hypothetical protein
MVSIHKSRREITEICLAGAVAAAGELRHPQRSRVQYGLATKDVLV